MKVDKLQLGELDGVCDNWCMAREEHTGKEWRGSFFAGREKRRIFRWVDSESKERVDSTGSFIGRLLGEKGEEAGVIACRWLESGDIEVIFPAMGAGRYVIAIDHIGQDGSVRRFLDGYAGYLEPEYVFKEISEAEETVVTLCDSERGREIWALAGDAADYSAGDAIEAAKKAQEAYEATLLELERASKFMESFNKALSEAVAVRENYLYIAGVNTGHYLRGEDGITPHIGADDYWYIGEKRLIKARGEDGITPHITSDGFWAFGDKKTTTRAEGRDGVDGVAMRRVLIKSTAELPAEEERGVFYYVKIGDKLYDVYVWVEGSGWTNVKETYDIATDRVHGLVKFTAGAVEEGANVGWVPDSDGRPTGEARVPMSGVAEPGVGKLGVGVTIDFGAPVGLNGNGAYYVGQSTTTQHGTIKLGTATTLDHSECAMLGVDSDGVAMVPAATLSSYGAVKLGTTHGANNPEPYRVGIGTGSDGQLCNNYLYLGAIRHMKPGQWRDRMDWLNNVMTNNSQWFNDTWYSGFLHTKQFTQTEDSGLELLPASETGEHCGGVFLAESMQDTRSACVTTPAVVMEYLNENYYKKSLVYSKTETDDEITQRTKNFLTYAKAREDFALKRDVENALEEKLTGKMYNRADVLKNVGTMYIMPNSKRGKLSQLKENDVYLLYLD